MEGVGAKMCQCAWHTASRKDMLDGARLDDPLGFNSGPVDPANSSRGRANQFDLQLIRRESLSVI